MRRNNNTIFSMLASILTVVAVCIWVQLYVKQPCAYCKEMASNVQETLVVVEQQMSNTQEQYNETKTKTEETATSIDEEEPQYAYVGGFSEEGLAVARKERGGKYGYINRKGKVVIDFIFEDADRFFGGRAVVEVDGLKGYIDTTGKIVIAPQYDYAGDFWLGETAKVRKGFHKYIIDKDGNTLEEITD